MGLTDVTGVFSRFFIVGFFVPTFFALAALKVALSADFVPPAVRPDKTGSFLVLGGAALALGLALLGLNYPIIRLMEGYALTEPRTGWKGRLLGAVRKALVERREVVFDDLQRKKMSDDRQVRRLAWWRLDLHFPTEREDLLPTRLGNTIRAFELYGRTRWGLSAIATWPRIEALLSGEERQLNADSESEFQFFLNSSVASLVVGFVLAIDGGLNHPHPLWLSWIYVVPFLLSYLLYLGSIGAAERWGERIRASVDLHRLELYEKLGLRLPGSDAEEREIAGALNKLIFWGTPIPQFLRDPTPKTGSSS